MKRIAVAVVVLAWVGGLGVLAAHAQPPASRGSQDTFTVGTATAGRGQTATGAIVVPPGVDAGTSIPVAVIHGARPGPVLALVAGSHGTEYASVMAMERLIASADPAAMSGTLIVIPLVNVPAFEQRVAHLNPVDGKNMNRFYPGKKDGTQTERAAYLITQHVVEQSDHLIDLHGGDTDESLRPYCYWTVTGRPQQDAVSKQMALAFGLDTIIISADRPADPAASRYLENTATTRGKPSITAEAGHAGTVDTDDVNALIDGCRSVMRYLKMLPGPPAPIEHPVWVERLANVASEATGMFIPLVKRGAYVEKGMRIGTVTDYLGKTIYEARAPEAGIVLYIHAIPPMAKGDAVASIGVPKRQ